MQKIRVGALISGGGTNLQAIIDACESEKMDASVIFVGTDNPNAKGLQRAHKHGIPTFIVDYTDIIRSYKKSRESLTVPSDFDLESVMAKQYLFSADTDADTKNTFMITRAAAESQLIEKMKPYPFDLLVLAGFMRNLTPYFIDRVNTDPENPRIMNIHPALLPSFAGVDGYGDTFRYGCKVGGCTVHFIDYGEDSGPIIGQRAFSIEPKDTLDMIKQKGLQQEWILYPQCIQWFAEKKLKVVRMTHDLESGKKYTRKVVAIQG